MSSYLFISFYCSFKLILYYYTSLVSNCFITHFCSAQVTIYIVVWREKSYGALMVLTPTIQSSDLWARIRIDLAKSFSINHNSIKLTFLIEFKPKLTMKDQIDPIHRISFYRSMYLCTPEAQALLLFG